MHQFQSTLPQGERLDGLLGMYGDWNFNPRSRKGSDCKNGKVISFINIFQSTLPQGERLQRKTVPGVDWRFQSTLPQGERRYNIYRKTVCNNFNPRSRKGSDLDINGMLPRAQISIHAPARGATNPGFPQFSDSVISIHAPARGATKSGSYKPY